MRRWSAVLLAGVLALPLGACGDDAIDGGQAASPSEPGPLAQALQERADASAAKTPPELQELFGRAAKELAASGILERAQGVGTGAPDVTFEDASGKRVALSALRANGPVVVAFYRGKW